MRKIERTTQFKRDKREMKGKYRDVLGTLLTDILNLLANDKPLKKNIAITLFLATGVIIAIATLSRI